MKRWLRDELENEGEKKRVGWCLLSTSVRDRTVVVVVGVCLGVSYYRLTTTKKRDGRKRIPFLVFSFPLFSFVKANAKDSQVLGPAG